MDFIVIFLIIIILVILFFLVFKRPKKKKVTKRKLEFVYVIAKKGFAFRKNYKIGKAKDYNKRLKQLQTGSPYDYYVVAFFETTKPFELESAAHRKYKKRRTRGEWYGFYFFEIPFVLKKIKKLNKKL